MIRDPSLEGYASASNRLREHLCAEQNLTLIRLEELAAAADLTAERHVTVCNRLSQEGAEGFFQELAATSGRINPTRSQGSTQQVRTCFSCGFSGHRSGDSKCPARGRTCFNCNEVGREGGCVSLDLAPGGHPKAHRWDQGVSGSETSKPGSHS